MTGDIFTDRNIVQHTIRNMCKKIMCGNDSHCLMLNLEIYYPKVSFRVIIITR